MVRGLAALASILVLSGCAPVTHVDQQTAATLAYEVKVYTPAELALLQWETVGSVQALSCQRMIFESSSEADAIDQLKFEAFSRHADGLLMRGCEKEGLDLVLNCWSSVTCRATLVRIIPPQTE